jgi:hypothetical protein
VENEKRGNLYPLRWTSLTEAMYDIRETFDWNSNELYVSSGAEDATPFHLPSMSDVIEIAPVDLVAETLRNITLSLLQVRSFPSFLLISDSCPLSNKSNKSFLTEPLVMCWIASFVTQ